MAFSFLYDVLGDLVGSRYITDGTGRHGIGPASYFNVNHAVDCWGLLQISLSISLSISRDTLVRDGGRKGRRRWK